MIANCLDYTELSGKYTAAFELLYKSSSDIAFLIDTEMNIATCNIALEEKFHLKRSEITGKPLQYLFETESFQTVDNTGTLTYNRLKNYANRVLLNGKPECYSEMTITENDELLYLNILLTPVASHNRIECITISVRDITPEIRINTGNGCKIAPWRECETERAFFIKTLLHDLKVPTLAQLRGVQLLQNQTLGKINLSQKEVLDEIVGSCSSVLDMISTIICAYRFDDGEISLGCKEFTAAEMLNDCRKRVCRDFRNPIDLKYEVTPYDLTLYAEAGVLKTMIANLILKIMTKYNPKKFVHIKAEKAGKFARFIISVKKGKNTKTHTEWVPFKSLLQNLKFTTVGYGIELYLCNKIITLHRGCAFVEIKDINIEQFLVEIPLEVYPKQR